MHTAVASPLRARLEGRVSARAVGAWTVPFAAVLYLGLRGGGYDSVVHEEVGIALWWFVLLGAAVGVLSAARLSRAALVALALLTGFAIWTALGIGWSSSSERGALELARVATYLGALALALTALTGDLRRPAVNGLAAALALLGVLALLSRLHPGWFPTNQTAAFLPGTRTRLSYPLNYWNGLGALIAVGVPLVLHVATSARTLIGRALAAAALPAMTLAGYLTFSRGGLLAGVVGVLGYLALCRDRLPRVATLGVCVAGAAILVAGASQRHAVEDGILNSTGRHQGASLLAMTIVVCAGVGLLQVAIALAERHGRLPGWAAIPRRPAAVVTAVAVVAGLALAVALGAPGEVKSRWEDFKRPKLGLTPGVQNRPQRFGNVSGNGRYQLWQAAFHAYERHPWRGMGPGSYEFWWARHASLPLFVRNAHSLYAETLGELGIVGLALLGGFLVWLLGTGAVRAIRAGPADRPMLAAATAVLAGFCVSAAFEWVWQIAVLPLAVLVLAAVVFAGGPVRERPFAARLAGRLGLVALAVAALVAIAIPLGTTTRVRDSQSDARAGHLDAAADSARTAQRLEPGAASPRIQQALVLELRGDYDGAAREARAAVAKEPVNWRSWVVLSRLEAERGDPPAAVAAFRHARALNPRSDLFGS